MQVCINFSIDEISKYLNWKILNLYINFLPSKISCIWSGGAIYMNQGNNEKHFCIKFANVNYLVEIP